MVAKSLRKHRYRTVYQINGSRTALRLFIDDTVRFHIMCYVGDMYANLPVPIIQTACGKGVVEVFRVLRVDVKNVMVMGGGTTAVRAVQTMPEYMDVKVIEMNPERCEYLNDILDNDKTLIINGDGRDIPLLTEEGIKNTQAFVALTGNAETNILACLTAKRLGVRKTVAMVENLDITQYRCSRGREARHRLKEGIGEIADVASNDIWHGAEEREYHPS